MEAARRRARAAAKGAGVGLLALVVLGFTAPQCNLPLDPPTQPVATDPAPASVLGVYVGPAGAAAAQAFGNWLGEQVPYAMDFLDGSSWSSISNPTWFLNQWGCHAGSPTCDGFRMVWGVPIIPNSGGSLAAGASGAYDQYFSQLASVLVAYGQGSAVIRLGWEFNGWWFPWSVSNATQAAEFVAYWHHIVDAMDSVPGASFVFEWNPTRGELAYPPDVSYPGDAYVGVIGLDVYDVQYPAISDPVQRFDEFLTEPYGLDWLVSFASEHHKPIAFPEWGLWPTGSGGNGGGDDPYFITQMAAFIADHDTMHATFWDYGSSAFSTGQYPNAELAFEQAFGSSGTGSSNSTNGPATSSTGSTSTTTSTTTAPSGSTSSTTTTTSPGGTSSGTTSTTTEAPGSSAGSSGSSSSGATSGSTGSPGGTSGLLPGSSGATFGCTQAPGLASGWQANGSAVVTGADSAELTRALQYQAGSVIWTEPVASSGLSVSFEATIGGGTGANGLVMELLDPSAGASALGEDGGGEGFAGLPGVAVSLTTYTTQPVELVGVATGQGAIWSTLAFAATAPVVGLVPGPVSVGVTVEGDTLTVTYQGSELLSVPVSVPPDVLVGFAAATGYFTDTQSVAGVSVVSCS